MIRSLQRRFVTTAMTAITVLLLLLLGGINIANIVIVGGEIDRTLHVVAQGDLSAGGFAPAADALAPRPGGMAPKNDYDTFLSANFFVVRFDPSGAAVYTDVSRTSAVTEEEARALAAQALDGDSDSGRSGRFRYLIQDVPGGRGKTAVFLDTSAERFSYLRVLLLSGAAGLVCWGCMLALVILLSRRAIRPIAESLEKQKQFVTNAGHELKTPLAIIQSNTEALELYNGESKWSRNIKEQILRLSGLMENLLALARMDEGAVQPRAADFCLSDLLAEAAARFAQPMEARRLSLESEIAPGVHLHADPRQIEQMISLLLDNAVKYADEGGAVCLRLAETDRQVVLELENTCPSLPAVPPEKLFDRFYRGDGARTQKSGGYGIGLSAARSLAQANRGSLRADYVPPRRIRFTARF